MRFHSSASTARDTRVCLNNVNSLSQLSAASLILLSALRYGNGGGGVRTSCITPSLSLWIKVSLVLSAVGQNGLRIRQISRKQRNEFNSSSKGSRNHSFTRRRSKTSISNITVSFRFLIFFLNLEYMKTRKKRYSRTTYSTNPELSFVKTSIRLFDTNIYDYSVVTSLL